MESLPENSLKLSTRKISGPDQRFPRDANLKRRVAEKFAGELESQRLVDSIFTPNNANGQERQEVKVESSRYTRSTLYLAMAHNVKLRQTVAALISNEQYCERLVELAFPKIVWIDGMWYDQNKLLTQTSKDDEFKQRLAKRYEVDPGASKIEWMKKVFPATVTIDSNHFDRDALYKALLGSYELRKTFAEKYHLASNEYYKAKLAEAAFRLGNDQRKRVVRINSINYLSEEELGKALAQEGPDFCRQVESISGYSRSQWLRDLYCERLIEEVFPETVRLRGRTYDKTTLRRELDSNLELRGELAEWYRWDATLQENVVENLMGHIFPMAIPMWGTDYSKEDLKNDLPGDPRLQQHLAAKTNYVPSKWLLEQEMQASRVWNGDLTAGDIYNIASERRLIGVCFSGGGVRSATFNLGVLQGLAELDLLPYIDYLSTVSGGGYIHEFLIGWILRDGSRSAVGAELIPQAEPGCLPRAPEPIQWLKRYSSYLTPSRGIFSTDTWTAFAIWMRNTVLNQIPILAAFVFGLLLLHLLVPHPVKDGDPVFTNPDTGGTGFWWTGLLLWLYGFASMFVLGRNLYLQEKRAATGSDSTSHLLTNRAVVGWIILPWFCCSLWMSYWVQMHDRTELLQQWYVIAIPCLLVLAVAELVILAGGTYRAYKSINPNDGLGRSVLAWFGFLGAGVLAAGVALASGWALIEATRIASAWLASWIGTALATVGAITQVSSLSTAAAHITVPVGRFQDGLGFVVDPWRIRLAILPPFLLSVPFVAIELTLGLLGRDYWNMRREWLARLRAWSLLYALLWMGLVSLTFLGPYVGYYIFANGTSRQLQWSAVIAFLASHLATILAGWSSSADGKPTGKGILGFKPMDLLAIVAAPVAIVTLLLALSFGTSIAVDAVANWIVRSAYSVKPLSPFIASELLCLTASFIVAALLGLRVDINEFSMHSFYRNRLSRCYLGATIPGKRQADPFTGFDDRSQVKNENGQIKSVPPGVSELLPKGYRTAIGKEGEYDGPFPIFCTTLNLTTGEDLATQERKGTSFAFTPLYSGYSVPWTDGHPHSKVSYNGYVPTDEYAYAGGGIHLDSAVAISGAALNPNQGYNSSPTLAFLMTFFNVRLGWWISNTRNMDTWPAASGRSTPLIVIYNLLKELFGAVGDAARYVNLSDGGHFENMGLYELVRRRCRYIIVCDAEADPEMKFEGMGGAITKCRADFGAEIDLDLRPLQLQQDTGCSKAHCVVGTIRYPPPPRQSARAPKATPCGCLGDRDDCDFTGVIVYMKSSLVGDEPADLLTHKLKCQAFPQDPTANQWFGETLFEAYRRLGHHIVMTTIRPALSPQETQITGREDLAELFNRMYAIWYPRTPEMERYLADHLEQLEDILKELREREELAGLEAKLNDPRDTSLIDENLTFAVASRFVTLPSVKWTVQQGSTQNAAYASQFAISLLRFMYTVYTDLQLTFPDNRISPHAEWWICLFRRWCRVELVQNAWVAHEMVFSEEFRLFARRELRLP